MQHILGTQEISAIPNTKLRFSGKKTLHQSDGYTQQRVLTGELSDIWCAEVAKLYIINVCF